MLETAIREALLDDDDIVDVIADRVRPLGVAPDDVRPFLTYQITGRQNNNTLAHGPSDWRKGEFEIGIYGDTYAQVMDVSNLVREYLDDLSITIADVEMDVLFEDETDVEEAPAEGDESPAAFVRTQTYRTLYRLTT